MEVVKQILDLFGHDGPQDLDLGEDIHIENGEFMPLVIERVTMDRLSVMQYYEQNGDTMRDPEVVFDVAGESWTVVEYRHDPMGIHDEGDAHLRAYTEFVDQWGTNLRRQGFVDAAQEYRETVEN